MPDIAPLLPTAPPIPAISSTSPEAVAGESAFPAIFADQLNANTVQSDPAVNVSDQQPAEETAADLSSAPLTAFLAEHQLFALLDELTAPSGEGGNRLNRLDASLFCSQQTPPAVETAPANTLLTVDLPAKILAQLSQKGSLTTDSSQTTASPATASPSILSAQLEQLLRSTDSQGPISMQIATGTVTLDDLQGLKPPVQLSAPAANTLPMAATTTVTPAAADEAASILVAATANDQTVPQAASIAMPATVLAGTARPSGDAVSPSPATSQIAADDGKGSELRINTQNVPWTTDNNETKEQSQQQSSDTAEGANSTLTASTGRLATSGESGSTFTQLIQGFTTASQASPSEAVTGKVSTVPLAPVSEEAVLQQIVERFQLLNRPLETRISMQLQPAELGALKIDLAIKDGTIRASVVAQSAHVQEILEKNLPKLRSLLESQSLVVGDIHISMENSPIEEYALFNEGQSRQQQNFSAPSQQSGNRGFDLAMEQAQEIHLATGLNIQV